MSKNPAAASSQNDPTKKAFKVYNFITSKGGEMELLELIKHPSPLKSLSVEEVLQWLNDFKELNDKEDVIEKPCFVVRRNNEDILTVRVLIKARLCLNYEKNGACKHEPNCLQFHICKGFLEGRCADSSVCSRSHDLMDKGNLNKIQKYRLEHLGNSSIRKVITRNLPFVCEGYVSQECTHPFCENLHVCPRLVKKICEDKEEDCPLNLSHDLHSPQNKRIFKDFIVPPKYLLCNILVSKDTRLEVTEKEGKRKGKGKVNKLNNLDTGKDEDRQEGGAQFSKLGAFSPNILADVSESASAKAPKYRQRKKNGSSDEAKIKNEELNIKPGLLPTPDFRAKLQQRNVDAEKRFSGNQPVPLMRFPIKPPQPVRPDFQEAFQNMLFPQDLEFTDHSSRGRQWQRRGGNNQFSRGGRKWKSMDHFHGPPPSDVPLVGQDGINRGGRGARGVRGRGSWRGRGRGTVLSEREGAPEMESFSADLLREENDDTSEPIKDARKRSRRPRSRKRKPKSNSADADNATNFDEEEEDEEDVEELKENLMKFKLEDECDQQDLINLDDGGESADLVDLNFEPDSGLSQASESQALWDIFSQDQLYDSLQDKDLDLTSNPDDSCQSNEPSSASVASERAVFNCIVKEFSGSVSFSEISTRADLFHPDFQDHEKWFRQHPKSFLRIYNPEGQLVAIKTFALRAKMCFKYCGKGCNNKNCPFFHVCEEFIAKGRCDAGSSCKRNHSFSDNHNKHITSKFFPKDHLDDQQLQVLIQSSTPQVCLDYNNGECRLGKHCIRIHICKNYGKKRCPKGSCHLSHNNALLTPATKSILQRYKVKGPPQVNGYILAKTLLVCEDIPVEKFKPRVVGKEQRKKSESTAVAENSYHISSNLWSHICLKFLLNRCKKGTKCTDHHCPMPYQWVYIVDNKWHMVIEDENINLEKFFCNERLSDAVITLTLNCSSTSSTAQAQENESYFYKVDFIEMHIKPLDEQGPNFPLKRLSTESEVHIPDCPLATKWRWFWKELEGFTEYKPKGDAKDPSSATIERHFLEGHGTYDFNVEPYDYRLYFKKKPMLQKNLNPKYYTEREVCRRPQYVSKQEFEKIKRSTHKLPIEDSREIPHLWVKMAECQEFLLYPLKTHSKEFKEMELKFLSSMVDKVVTINSIDRVQNPFMMEKYLRKKNHMQKRSNGQNVDERFLFHGTSHRNIRPICKQNFDWRLYGEVTGNIHGEGAYFAKESSLSDCYCPEDEDGFRYIFIAKALVGSFTKGDKKYKRPPHKDANDPHSDLHDSCVDKVENPRIFVVFDVDQYYPAYLVTYKRQDTGHRSSIGATVTSIPKRPAPARPSSTSYGYSGSNLPSSSSYTSSAMPSGPYSPTSPSASNFGAAATHMPSSSQYAPPGPQGVNLASAMDQQWEDFSHSAAGKKSNQNNCAVM